ncbi:MULTISPECIES: P-II family nitrogen regulator [Clostridium]|uniref:P-II family nitrogen regulator n=1 Tax=Clostridium TaxID=1485 RepID=UPI00069FF3F3|nr:MULTISPECIES: P-II family nitrogen regulator [Clostridium]KOF56995.1 nitrogen fixation protein [Clostridium sp. DMHC 10]MCD2348926.1 P-II family nitrogen regulator [Clostridium guangxiense]
MKEVTAIIRMNMINATKDALLKSKFSSFTCRKVVGRGKKKVRFLMIDDESIENKAVEDKKFVEDISETHRLVPKRMLTILVKDEDLQELVELIIDVNRTSNPGDGKIFVSDVTDVYRIRTGEVGEEAL